MKTAFRMFTIAFIVAAGALFAVPASAATAGPFVNEEADCTVGPFSGICQTHAIPAHSSQHFIYVHHVQTPPADGGTFRVYDAANGNVVWSLGLGDDQYRGGITIPGLYSGGGYYCRVSNSSYGGACEITNYT